MRAEEGQLPNQQVYYHPAKDHRPVVVQVCCVFLVIAQVIFPRGVFTDLIDVLQTCCVEVDYR